MEFFAFLKPNVQRMEKKRDIDRLIKTLNNKDLSIRENAAAALGRLGDTEAVQALVQSMTTDSAFWVVKAAGEALQKIGLPSDPSVQAYYWALKKQWRRVTSFGAAAIEPLIKAITWADLDWFVRPFVPKDAAEKCLEEKCAILDALTEINDRATVKEALRKLLKNTHIGVRTIAAMVLDEIDDVRAMKGQLAIQTGIAARGYGGMQIL